MKICSICQNKRFSIKKVRSGNISKCRNCGTEYLEDSFKPDTYKKDYFKAWSTDKTPTFLHYLKHLEKAGCVLKDKNLLDIGCATGFMLDAAKIKGCTVSGIDISKYAVKKAKEKHYDVYCGRLGEMKLPKKRFDIITMTDVIEHFNDPQIAFNQVIPLIKKGGYVLITTPEVGSFTNRIMDSRWFQYKEEHLVLFTRKSIKKLLKNNGFDVLLIKGNKKILPIDYIQTHFNKYPTSGITQVLNILGKILPKRVLRHPFKIPITGEMIIVARYDGKDRK